MLATKTRLEVQNSKTESHVETIPTLLEIRRRINEIRNNWTVSERETRSAIGQKRLDDLATTLGLGR